MHLSQWSETPPITDRTLFMNVTSLYYQHVSIKQLCMLSLFLPVLVLFEALCKNVVCQRFDIQLT